MINFENSLNFFRQIMKLLRIFLLFINLDCWLQSLFKFLMAQSSPKKWVLVYNMMKLVGLKLVKLSQRWWSSKCTSVMHPCSNRTESYTRKVAESSHNEKRASNERAFSHQKISCVCKGSESKAAKKDAM